MRFLAGIVVGLLILPFAAVLYVESGRMPAATTDPPFPFEKVIAWGALRARIRREAPTRDVSAFTTGQLLTGAAIYQKDCALCHGLPQQPVSPVAQGEYPAPPQLFTTDGRVTDDPAGVTYWKVKNGIRLTGMPGFGKSFSDDDLWQVSGLVARADKLPPEVMDALRPQASPTVAGAGGNPAFVAPPGSALQ